MHKVKLYYDNELPNFGDELNIFIVRKLNLTAEYAPLESCNAIFIGSLLGRFFSKRLWLTRRLLGLMLLKPRVLVWGGGYVEINNRKDMRLFRRLDVRACRGFLTLERLRQCRHAKIAENIVCADPGLLASRFIDTSHVKKKYKLGIIPHYVDKDNYLLSNITVENSVIIDIQQPPEVFMNTLAECENVLSSALHGLIAADSLGIPNARLVLSDKIKGGDYKYNDYYSAFGLKSHMRVNLAEGQFTDGDIDTISSAYAIKQEQVTQLQDALLHSFPYK